MQIFFFNLAKVACKMSETLKTVISKYDLDGYQCFINFLCKSILLKWFFAGNSHNNNGEYFLCLIQ